MHEDRRGRGGGGGQKGQQTRVVNVNDNPGGDAGVDPSQVLSQPLPLVAAGVVVNIGGQIDHMGGTHVGAVVAVAGAPAAVAGHLCQQHAHLLSGHCKRQLDVQPKQ